MSETNTHRIFFALWPDDPLRQQLKQTLTPLRPNTKARHVPMHNWHITLAFLGNVTEAIYECAQQQAGDITGPAFDLSLDQFGFWPRPRVVWLGCSHLPEALGDLVSKMNNALQACEYSPESKNYTPHLTLLRKANQALDVRRVEPIHWHVDQFVLVESLQTRTGSVYKVIRRWPLSCATA